MEQRYGDLGSVDVSKPRMVVMEIDNVIDVVFEEDEGGGIDKGEVGGGRDV